MTNHQLNEYIEQQLQQGKSKEEIKEKLIESGWKKEDVNTALNIEEEATPPPPPSTPSFIEVELKNLSPKAFWLFFLKKAGGLFFLLIFIFFQLAFLEGPMVIIFAVIFFLIMSGIFFLWAKFEYKFYKYGMSQNGFQKEYGIIAKKYVTIPYERIQNIDMSQTLLERILGLYDINIQTAGMSVSMGRFGPRRAEGMLPGISKEEAENLRDELIRRSRQKGGSGV